MFDQIDVSVILNIHRESRLIDRTLASLDCAVRNAKDNGIKTEIIIVADNSDSETLDAVARRDFNDYISYTLLEVSNGSLGLSRNDGIHVARGRYILTSDADDLISENFILESHRQAETQNGRFIYFPEYIYAFGERYHLCKYFNISDIGITSLFTHHGFNSRIFARREHIENLKYIDLRLSAGFAFEDWYFNSEAVASGLDLRITKGTTLYYRQRSGSLLTNANSISARITKAGALHQPERFLELVISDIASGVLHHLHEPQCEVIYQEFSNDKKQIQFLKKAHEIDPAIEPSNSKFLTSFSNFQTNSYSLAWGKVCAKLIGYSYSDVAILPYIDKAGGEQYIFNICNSILSQDSNARLLVLTGQSFHAEHYKGFGRERVDYLDLYELLGEDDTGIDLFTMRVVEVFAENCRLHLKSSPYAMRFFRRYCKVLPCEAIFYRFCDTYYHFEGEYLPSAETLTFIEEVFDYLAAIITDNSQIIKEDVKKLPFARAKYRLIKNKVDFEDRSALAQGVQHFLWASRVADQKRPYLLAPIVSAVRKKYPKFAIDVWGGGSPGYAAKYNLENVDGINLMGPYTSIESLPFSRYRGYIYTSLFDGLPNSLLEAAAHSLPIITVTEGGIGDFASDETSWIVSGCSEDELIQNYADAICECIIEEERANKIIDAALNRIKVNHSKETFDSAVESLVQDLPTDQKLSQKPLSTHQEFLVSEFERLSLIYSSKSRRTDAAPQYAESVTLTERNGLEILSVGRRPRTGVGRAIKLACYALLPFGRRRRQKRRLIYQLIWKN